MSDDLIAQLNSLTASIGAGVPYSRVEAVKLLTEAGRQLRQSDPLGAFPPWDAETPLGPDHDDAPGYHGTLQADQLVGLSGAWATSTRLGVGTPGVWIRLGVRTVGQTDHHIIEAVCHGDTARELGIALYAAAERAPLDDAADRLWNEQI